jgi:threonyl-tRNA synthetase
MVKMPWEDNGNLGTIQVDYNLPERFDLTTKDLITNYIDQ